MNYTSRYDAYISRRYETIMARRNEPAPLPSDAQWEVMNVVWQRGEATVGEVWQAVSARRPLARNTVLTLVARLEEKGWLRRRAEGNVLRYRATVPQQAALRQIARRLVDTAFQGSAEGLIMTLLGDSDLSEGESERIRAMLDSARREKKGRSPP
jgi:BlaI family transcriptional regulator, penicillinase repressor